MLVSVNMVTSQKFRTVLLLLIPKNRRPNDLLLDLPQDYVSELLHERGPRGQGGYSDMAGRVCYSGSWLLLMMKFSMPSTWRAMMAFLPSSDSRKARLTSESMNPFSVKTAAA